MPTKKKTKVIVVENVAKPPGQGTSSSARRRRAKKNKEQSALGNIVARRRVGGGNRSPKGILQRMQKEHINMAKASHGPGLSKTAEDWLKLALNPCDRTLNYHGFPDENSSNVVRPKEFEAFDVRFDLTTPTEPGMFKGTPDESALWNLFLISSPGTLSTYFLIYQGSIANPSYYAIYTNRDRILPHLQDAGFVSSRVAAYGTTVYMEGSTLYNQGHVISAQITPNWRKTRAQLLPDPGAEESVAMEVFKAWALNGGSVNNATPGELFEFTREILTTDPHSTEWEAKYGAYFPHKLNNTINPLRKHDFGIEDDVDTTIYINPFYTAFHGTPADLTTMPAEAIAFSVIDGEYDWDASVFIANGISTQTSFEVKKYVYVEGQVTPRSELRYYTCAPMDESERALELYKHIARQMPSAHISAANAFGWLKKAFNWTKNAVKWVGNKVVKPFRPILDTIPVVNTALAAVDSVANTADQFTNMILR